MWANSNPVRVRILPWLKDPDAHFSRMIHLPEEEQGKGYLCVGAIQEKAGVTQSTAAEGILQTLIENGKKTYENPEDCDSRANLVWCSTMALKRWHDCFFRAGGFNVIKQNT